MTPTQPTAVNPPNVAEAARRSSLGQKNYIATRPDVIAEILAGKTTANDWWNNYGMGSEVGVAPKSVVAAPVVAPISGSGQNRLAVNSVSSVAGDPNQARLSYTDASGKATNVDTLNLPRNRNGFQAPQFYNPKTGNVVYQDGTTLNINTGQKGVSNVSNVTGTTPTGTPTTTTPTSTTGTTTPTNASVSGSTIDDILSQYNSDTADKLKKDEANSQFTSALDTNYNQARGKAERLVGERGLSYSDYSADIERQLTNARAGIPQGTTSFAGLFNTDNVVNDILNGRQSSQRAGYTNQVNELFPQNFDQNAFGDTYDDNAIQGILDEQFNPAQDQVKRSWERGLLNDAGYSSANAKLGTQRTAGNAALQGIGSTILSGYRDKVKGIGDEAKTGASSFQLGQSFDPNAFKTRLDTTVSDLGGRFEGDLRNTLGGQNFFDVGELIQSGKDAQGTVNNRNSSLLDTIAQRKGRKATERGLGTQGVF